MKIQFFDVRLVLMLFIMTFILKQLLQSNIKRMKNYVNVKDSSFWIYYYYYYYYYYYGFISQFRSWVCNVSNILIQKFFPFSISWITSYGLLLFVMVSIRVSLAWVLKLWLLWVKWQHTGTPLASDISNFN